ncbi:sugar phosphate isomerase/epimerase [Paenibacillus filicis]|uniref:Sugar phosphate isomerase/epimerase n=1 Tax=Paenibacillus filicis TaxID=669464 RepID=A0ABU9DSI8_9BACL
MAERSRFQGKIAAHAITWGQQHLQAVQDISKLGYRGIEPWASFALQYEDRPQAFRELLSGYGLSMTALYGGASGGQDESFGSLAARERILGYNVRLANLLAACEADILVLGPGGTRSRPTTPEELKIAAETVNELARRTAAIGVKACLHPHLWTEVQDEHEVAAMMELTDPDLVYFAPDSAHLLGAGMDPAAIIRKYGDRVAYVHLKDLTPRPDNPDHERGEELPFFCELGQGSVDTSSVLEVLTEIGYTGWVTLEVDESGNSPYQSMEICRDYVERQLGIPVRG